MKNVAYSISLLIVRGQSLFNNHPRTTKSKMHISVKGVSQMEKISLDVTGFLGCSGFSGFSNVPSIASASIFLRSS